MLPMATDLGALRRLALASAPAWNTKLRRRARLRRLAPHTRLPPHPRLRRLASAVARLARWLAPHNRRTDFHTAPR